MDQKILHKEPEYLRRPYPVPELREQLRELVLVGTVVNAQELASFWHVEPEI